MVVDWNGVADLVLESQLPGVAIGALLAYWLGNRASRLSAERERRWALTDAACLACLEAVDIIDAIARADRTWLDRELVRTARQAALLIAVEQAHAAHAGEPASWDEHERDLEVVVMTISVSAEDVDRLPGDAMPAWRAECRAATEALMRIFTRLRSHSGLRTVTRRS